MRLTADTVNDLSCKAIKEFIRYTGYAKNNIKVKKVCHMIIRSEEMHSLFSYIQKHLNMQTTNY